MGSVSEDGWGLREHWNLVLIIHSWLEKISEAAQSGNSEEVSGWENGYWGTLRVDLDCKRCKNAMIQASTQSLSPS